MFSKFENKLITKLLHTGNKLSNKFIMYINSFIYLFNYTLYCCPIYIKNKIFFNYNYYIKLNYYFYKYIYKNNNFNTYKKTKILTNKFCSHKFKILFNNIINLPKYLKENSNYILNNKKYLFLIYLLLGNIKIIHGNIDEVKYYNCATHNRSKKVINKLNLINSKIIVYFYFSCIINKTILKDVINSINIPYITYPIYCGKSILKDINYSLYLFYVVYIHLKNIYEKNKCSFYSTSYIKFFDKIILNSFKTYFKLNKNTKKYNNISTQTFYSVINKFIFGQNLITKKLTTYLFDFNKKSKIKPIGSFLLCGPSGTGKTELVKIITNYIYSSNNNLIQLDMSEYKEKHSLSRLIGSPPGYVGHEEGGNLINKINNNPNSVLLFDEIEKANKDIFSIFLQILDEGILTDSKGISCRFDKTIIFFTSNLGSRIFKEVNKNEEFNIKYYNKVKEEVNNNFKLEFINRINDIFVFNPLYPVKLYNILDKYIYNNYDNKIFTSDFIKSLLSFISYSPSQGSRFCINNINKIINNIDLIKKNKISGKNSFVKYIILK